MNRTTTKRSGRRGSGLRGWPSFQQIRDSVLLVLGTGLLANEALLVPEPRALLVGIAAVLLGIPPSLLADRLFVRPPAQIDERDEP